VRVVPPTVFLSYARADQKQAAKLAEALEAAGLKVWWDTMIEGGAVFSKSIEAALSSSDAVIVGWSRTSVESDWVLDEAAKGRDFRKLVPVSFDGTAPPLGFGQYHSIDLSRWHGNADGAEIVGLIRAIASVTSKDIPAPPRPARGKSPPTFVTRRALLVSTSGLAIAGVAGLIAWRRGLIGGSVQPSGNSVAVLPFENLSGDPDQAYFSDGLSEEVRATLARNVMLLVMAETSSGKFRDRKDDAKTIAATLGVAFLLDGSVRRAGEVVRVAADLIDGATGFSRWSRTFDRSMRDIFAVQSEIADAVASALAAQVTAADAPVSANGQELSSSGGTTNIAAYDEYLRGRALYDLSSDEAAERAALARFDAAIAADPNYAAAHAARSRSLTAIANQYGEVGQQDESTRRRSSLPSARLPSHPNSPTRIRRSARALSGAPGRTCRPRALREFAPAGPGRRQCARPLFALLRTHRPQERGGGRDAARIGARPAESAHPPRRRRHSVRRPQIRRFDSSGRACALDESENVARACRDRRRAADARAVQRGARGLCAGARGRRQPHGHGDRGMETRQQGRLRAPR
jgi:TolB-like protein